MKKVLFLIGIVSLLMVSCARSMWPSRVPGGGPCPQNAGIVGTGGPVR
jgi:hypothetical protein